MTTETTDRRTFVALGLQYVVNALVYSTYLARLPDLRSEVGLSLGQMGAVMTTGNLAGLLATVFAGRLLRAVGSKQLLVGTALVYVLALPAIGTATSAPVLIAAVVTMMVSNSFVDVALAKQSGTFGARRGTAVMGRLAGLYSIGTVGGAVVAAWISGLGVEVTWHLLGLTVALVLALVFVTPGLLPGHTDRATEHPPSGATAGRAALVAIGLASAVAVPLDVGPGEWATFRVADDLGYSAGLPVLAYACFAGGMCVARLAGDWAADTFGRDRVMRWSIVTSVVGIVAACLSPALPVVLGGFLLAGVGAAAPGPLLIEFVAERSSASITAFFLGNRLAGLLAPVTIGGLADTAQFSVGGAILIVTVPCALLLFVTCRWALPAMGAKSSPGDR